jgi:UDP-N-acetylglucosamine 2-epimerase (non-hydrolysing)
VSKKILIIFGTRPEIIKLYPVHQELLKYPEKFETQLCDTGQHLELVQPFLQQFSLKPDYQLLSMVKGQSLSELTQTLLLKIDSILKIAKPNLVIVQGDTTSAMVGALAAFYCKIPVAHVEAGLRTYQIYAPFPEEVNRGIVSKIARFHFAPTTRAVQNLKLEKVEPANIYLTGNTVVDALEVNKKMLPLMNFDALRKFYSLEFKTILVTAHRRENFDGGLEDIFKTLVKLKTEFPDLHFVFPVHLNPHVQQAALELLGSHSDRIHLLPPVGYFEMLWLMQSAYLVLTDSGGIQEEAPSFGKPVLVLREHTERMEAVVAGCAKLVGSNPDKIYEAAKKLLTDTRAYEKMSRVQNPFGNGFASKKIVEILLKEL